MGGPLLRRGQVRYSQKGVLQPGPPEGHRAPGEGSFPQVMANQTAEVGLSRKDQNKAGKENAREEGGLAK